MENLGVQVEDMLSSISTQAESDFALSRRLDSAVMDVLGVQVEDVTSSISTQAESESIVTEDSYELLDEEHPHWQLTPFPFQELPRIASEIIKGPEGSSSSPSLESLDPLPQEANVKDVRGMMVWVSCCSRPAQPQEPRPRRARPERRPPMRAVEEGMGIPPMPMRPPPS